MKEWSRRALQFVLPALVIGAGVLVARYLVATAPKPERTPSVSQGVLVEVETVETEPHTIVVEAQGSVVAARTVNLVPQVGGQVTWVSDALVVGGRVTAGDPLLRIDSRDYRIAVRQRAAEVSQAKLALDQEESRRRVAAREWALLGEDVDDVDEEGRALALREPFVANAEVAVDAAESALQRARLDLSRTTLRAPFNAIVQAEGVDVGQVVAPTSVIATLVGSDVFWIQASVPVDALPWLRFADTAEPGEDDVRGSLSRVFQEAGRARQVREARVLRLLGDLDPVGRMARVIVEVPNPMGDGLGDGAPGLPLLVGTYVTVEMDGPEVPNLVEVPRVALREGGAVYVMTNEDTLDIRPVSLLWRREESVLVDDGLEPGERIVTSRIPSPVEGMKLRISPTGTETETDDTGGPRAEATR